VRALIKGCVEQVVVRSGLARLSSLGRRNRTLVLAYHNIIAPGDPVPGDRSLHLDLRDFRDHLDLLQQHGTVIPLDEALSPAPPGSPPRFVITFDDAYRGTVLVGFPELRARKLPATLFVPPGLLGGEPFWWDAVPISGWEDPAPLGELRGEGARVREWAVARGLALRDIPPLQRPCTLEELEAALTDDLITVGCHTWDHPNLTQLSPMEIEAQMIRSTEWIRDRGLPKVDWVSYPYGLTDETVRGAIRNLGFDGALRVDGGWFPPRSWNALDLPRMNVPAGLSGAGFRMLIAGLRRG